MRRSNPIWASPCRRNRRSATLPLTTCTQATHGGCTVCRRLTRRCPCRLPMSTGHFTAARLVACPSGGRMTNARQRWMPGRVRRCNMIPRQERMPRVVARSPPVAVLMAAWARLNPAGLSHCAYRRRAATTRRMLTTRTSPPPSARASSQRASHPRQSQSPPRAPNSRRLDRSPSHSSAKRAPHGAPPHSAPSPGPPPPVQGRLCFRTSWAHPHPPCLQPLRHPRRPTQPRTSRPK